MDEMGLVVVAAIERDLCPIDLPCVVYGVEGLLEAAHAAEGFGCESDLPVKDFDETARAEADFFRECCDGDDVRRTANVMDCIGYGGVPRQWARELRVQILFEDAEDGGNGGGGEHTLAKVGSSCAPEIVQCDGCVLHLICGWAKEGKCASGMELDADDALLLRGVDDEVAGTRAGDDGVSIGVEAAYVVCVIDADGMVVQVEDDGGFAVRHEPFMRVRALGDAFPVPEALHELR